MTKKSEKSDETSDEKPAEKTPTWLKWVTRISIVIGLSALVATIVIVGPQTIFGHLRTIGWLFFALVALDVLCSVCDATAVYFMAHGPGRPTWRHSVVAQLAGRGVNSVTPGGNLGEALKVSLLSQHCSPKRIVAAVMYVGLVMAVIQFGVIAAGSAATAFLFDLPRAAMIALLVGAAVAACIAVGIIVLVNRGMLSTLSNVLAKLHIISKKRRQKWSKSLEDVDRRLQGLDDGDHRRKAITFIVISQLLQKVLTYVTVLSAGYALGAGQYLALLSAGVLLGWISAIIPMGLGISEGGNVALFTLIGAPAALGLALALARRVNQVVFAVIGFIVLAGDRVASRVHGRVSARISARRLKPSHSHS